LNCVSAITREGRRIWIVDAHRYGKRFIVRADEKVTPFYKCKGLYTSRGEFDREALPFVEIALVLVRFDQVASRVVNSNH